MKPGWEKEINLSHLDVGSSRDCVLGQLYGSYVIGALTLNLSAPACDAFGFYNRTNYRYTELNHEWQRYIEGRLAAKN